jgi:hypothetical protein
MYMYTYMVGDRHNGSNEQVTFVHDDDDDV